MRKRILCYGDSNTWGYRPDGNGRFEDEVRWPGVMQAELGDDYTVVVEGYNGRTTVFDDPIEQRMNGLDYFYACLESQSPLDLVIVMLGTNDLKPRFSASAGSIALALRKYAWMLNTAPMAGERPKLLLAAPPLIDPSYKNVPEMVYAFGDDADARSRELGRCIAEIAGVIGAGFIDATEYAHAATDDGCHMDADNHRLLGLAMASRVREILAKEK